jgi:hypothetical protein
MNAWIEVDVERTEAGTWAVFTVGEQTRRLSVAPQNVRGARLRVWVAEQKGDDAVVVIDGPGGERGHRVRVPRSLIAQEPTSHVDSSRRGWLLLGFVAVVALGVVLGVLHKLGGP